MKRNGSIIALFFLLLIVALVLTAAHETLKVGATITPTAWLPVPPATDTIAPSQTPGWWDELPTPIPFPSPTVRKEMSPIHSPIHSPVTDALSIQLGKYGYPGIVEATDPVRHQLFSRHLRETAVAITITINLCPSIK